MENKNVYYIGLDDTDFGDSIGTGALARELAQYLQRELDATPEGITRHQFLIHPDIPYTSHNSGACIQIRLNRPQGTVEEACKRFVGFLFHPGADPGLCVARKEQCHSELVRFGRDAQTRVVSKEQACRLAKTHNITLEELGGDGIGVIGALSSCALRMDGNDGRFIGLEGIRTVKGVATVQKILENTAVEEVVDETFAEVSLNSAIETNNWVRPSLVNSKVVLRVSRDKQTGGYFIKKEKRVVIPKE